LTAFGTPVAFSFAGKLYTGTALGPDRARFMLDPRYATRLEDGVQTATAIASGRYVDLGSLHFVVDLADLDGGLSLDQLDVATLGATLRHHERFAPLGVNVNFCLLIDGEIHIRTFERGVEGETLACGTGSTASALSYALRNLVSAPVHIITKSGEELIIDFDDPARPSRLSLEGPARVVFEGRI
jgi:diaminopimelate epimerase